MQTEDQLVTHFDKWMYVIKNLSRLDHRPNKLREKIFEKAFHSAEIEKLSPEERQNYENSLKYYRDLNNIIDTSFSEGKLEGLHEGIEKGDAGLCLLKKNPIAEQNALRYNTGIP